MNINKLSNINDIGRLIIISNLYIEEYSLNLTQSNYNLALLNRINL